jgi:hypothetical protein
MVRTLVPKFRDAESNSLSHCNMAETSVTWRLFSAGIYKNCTLLLLSFVFQ